MLISLLVLAFEQIIVAIWVKHDSIHSWPITLLEPLVVLIGGHRICEKISNENGEKRKVGFWGKIGEFGLDGVL